VPLCPRVQRQSVSVSLCSGATECAGHCAQASIPTSAANVSAAHDVHSPPGGPKKPRLHRQSVCASLPAGASEPAGHAAQLAMPSASAYAFSGHSVQGPPGGP